LPYPSHGVIIFDIHAKKLKYLA